jgi:hypothetical protein
VIAVQARQKLTHAVGKISKANVFLGAMHNDDGGDENDDDYDGNDVDKTTLGDGDDGIEIPFGSIQRLDEQEDKEDKEEKD